MRRRDFITFVGGAATACEPVIARPQPAPPVIGFLAQGTPDGVADFIASVRKGLGETGLVEGKDFTGEMRFAGNVADRVPALAVDLVQRRVALVIVVDTLAAARAAKAATMEIPIVFTVGTDPVQSGLVANLNHPGGNVTGISSMNLDLGSKWIGMLHELLPMAKHVGVLVNVDNAEAAKSIITSTQEGARALGLQTEILFASTNSDIDAVFAGLGNRVQALTIQGDVLFLQNRSKLAELAIREKLPTIFSLAEFPKAGGLMSYGSNFNEAHRQAGVYAARILKGEKPGDLPVQRATKFDLIINLKTAKALNLAIPSGVMAIADEVIE